MRPSQRTRDSEPSNSVPLVDRPPTARAMSFGVWSVYFAVQRIEPGASYVSVPSRPAPARMVRRPLMSNRSLRATSRCSIWSSGSGLPALSRAVPCTSMVPPPVTASSEVTIGRSAVTPATVVCSETPLESMIRILSPAWMFGVTPSQQPPPGWLTSARPVASATTFVDVAMTLPPRTTANE